VDLIREIRKSPRKKFQKFSKSAKLNDRESWILLDSQKLSLNYLNFGKKAEIKR